jgi:hypothetical protein
VKKETNAKKGNKMKQACTLYLRMHLYSYPGSFRRLVDHEAAALAEFKEHNKDSIIYIVI